MSKKSKKKLAKAEAMMAEALRMKAEVIKTEAIKAASGNIATMDSTATTPLNTQTSLAKKKRAVYVGIAGVIILAVLLFFSFNHFNGNAFAQDSASNGLSAPTTTEGSGIDIIEKWEMPDELTEISSNTFIDADRIACVQDNDGIIFTYNLKTKKVENKLTFGSPEWKKEGIRCFLNPSEIVINPKSREIYVLNGPKSQFIIADSLGKTIITIQLDKSVFPQPEGMSFSPSGELYISSEGKAKGGGIIAKVDLRRPSGQ